MSLAKIFGEFWILQEERMDAHFDHPSRRAMSTVSLSRYFIHDPSLMPSRVSQPIAHLPP